MIKFCYSLFSGCGGSDRGMAQAGYTPLGGVEIHSPAANIYDLNHEFPLTRANILDVDRIPTVDLLWASPPCQSHSIANQNRGETGNDIALAQHVARLMVESRPRHIAIENVRAYGKSKSLAIIYEALVNAGYDAKYQMVDSSDYNAPTKRIRLIARFSLETMKEIVKPNICLKQKVSWWQAIKPFIYDLPINKLTIKQLKALSEVNQDKPLLIERCGYYYKPKIYPHMVQCPTIRAHVSIDDRGSYRRWANIIFEDVCYDVDIPHLGYLQGFPLNYNWGSNKGEAGRGIGNSVVPAVSHMVALSFGV